MSKHIDQLMGRASVAVMANFAPKPEGGTDTSKIGQAERVEAEPAGGDDDAGDALGLSAEEQAQFDAMQAGRDPAAKDDIQAGAAGDEGDGDGASDGDGDDDGDGDGEPADGEPGAREPAAGEGDKRKSPKTISYGRHQRDLAKIQKERDDLQARLDGAAQETAKEREARMRLDERTKMLLEAIQSRPAPAATNGAAAEPDADPEPDGEADPIAHLQWQNRQLAKTVQEMRQGQQQTQQQTAAEREEQQLYQAYEGDLAREAQVDATFADAFVHLRETRYRELGFIYANIDITDPEQCKRLSPEDQGRLSAAIQRSFHNEQMMVAREAIRARQSPARVVRNLAIARGFAPKAAPAAGDPPPPPKPANGGGDPAPRQVAPAAPGSVKDQLEAIRAGQEAAKSLSDAGGSPGGVMTPERIEQMSDDEFADFYETNKRNFDRMMGKPAHQ